MGTEHGDGSGGMWNKSYSVSAIKNKIKYNNSI